MSKNAGLSLLWIVFGCQLVTPAWSQVLVDSDWLAANLGQQGIVIVDMSNDDMQYQRFHLPTAVRLPYYALLQRKKSDKFPRRIDDKTFTRLLGHLGISRKSHVVIYDDVGGLNAGRLYWQLDHINHPKTSVLDGGIVTWILERRVVSNKPIKPATVVYGDIDQMRNNEAFLTDLSAGSGSRATATLLDVRTKEEYIGDQKRRQGGHIPGSRWWPWEQSVNYRQGFLRQKSSFLKRSLQSVGVNQPSQPIIAYCRSGHRASQTYLVLRSLGFYNVKLYVNSMNEYGRLRKSYLKRGIDP